MLNDVAQYVSYQNHLFWRMDCAATYVSKFFFVSSKLWIPYINRILVIISMKIVYSI
jgi:hypothetical protein